MANHSHIVFFDGVCVFCNNSVQFLIKLDTHRVLKYSTLQGRLAEQVLKTKAADVPSGVVFWSEDKLYEKSDAIVHILKNLSGFYGFLGWMLNLFPTAVLNVFYNLFAKYRYRLFGKHEICVIPSEDEKHLFID